MSALNPISPKVVAAAAGAGAGLALANLILWLLGVFVFGVSINAQAEVAITAVPSPIANFLAVLITVAGAAIPGYGVNDPARQTDGPVAVDNTAQFDPEVEANANGV